MRDAENGNLVGSTIGEFIGKVVGIAGAVRIGLGLDSLVQKFPEVSTDARVTFDITMAALSAILLAKMGGKIGAYMGYHGILNSIPQAYRDFKDLFKAKEYSERKIEH